MSSNLLAGSSTRSEQSPYKRQVDGSNPSPPTNYHSLNVLTTAGIVLMTFIIAGIVGIYIGRWFPEHDKAAVILSALLIAGTAIKILDYLGDKNERRS